MEEVEQKSFWQNLNSSQHLKPCIIAMLITSTYTFKSKKRAFEQNLLYTEPRHSISK